MKSDKNPLKRLAFEILLVIKPSRSMIVTTFLLILLGEVIESPGQVFYGTTSGGEFGMGSVFKVNADGTEYQNILFEGGGAGGVFAMVKHSNGKIYGITPEGGESNEGVLFEFDPNTGKTELKVSFYYYDNGRPEGDLIEHNGKLYMNVDDMSPSISSFDPLTNKYVREITLPVRCTGMTLADGKFYGMTGNGGTQRAGSIFEFNPQTSTYTVLVQFDHTSTGRYADAGLTYANGKLYGLVRAGGQYGQGTLVEYDLGLKIFKKKIDFKLSVNGATPLGELSYLNGKLYGITASGGIFNQGILFEYNPATESLIKVVDFSHEHPRTLFKQVNDALWATLGYEGSNNEGSLVSFNPITNSWSTLIDLDIETTGSVPTAYILDGNTVWGSAANGGEGNAGTFFEYDLISNHPEIRYSFNYFPQGRNPTNLSEINNKFYGITSKGGTFNVGVLFEYDQANSNIKPLYNFNCDNCEPGYASYEREGKLLAIGNKLYGVAWIGGNEENSVLFEYDLVLNSYVSIHEFNDVATGIGPLANMEIINGKVYGTTKRGGANNQGVLYEYDPTTSAFVTKLSLSNSTTGTYHKFTVIGNILYGLSQWVSGNGLLSSYNPMTNTLTPLYELQKRSSSELVSSSNKLYGVTRSYYDQIISPPYVLIKSTVFEFDLTTQQYHELYVFKNSESSDGRLKMIGNKLYGVEEYGTSFFEFNVDNTRYHKLTNVLLSSAYNDKVNSFFVKDGDSSTLVPVVNEVIEFTQGKRRDGGIVPFDRSDAQKALYYADANDNNDQGIKFVSLGFGGSITLSFDQPLCNKEGYDLHIFETSYGNPSFFDYPEQAEVFISEEGGEWISLGRTNPTNPQTNCQAKLDSDFDIESSGLECIKYIKLVDVTERLAKRRDKNTCVETSVFVFNNAADGFDLDAIETIRSIGQSNSSGRIAQNVGSGIVNLDTRHTTALLFPNPVSKTLVIDLSEETEMAIMSDELTLEIIDLHGRVVNQSSDALDDSWTITHDVSQLNNGFYVARISTGNVRRNYKFIKN